MSGRLNLNQFALPGMEHLAHAGAPHLAEGRGFRYEHESEPDTWRGPTQHVLEMYSPDYFSRSMKAVGRLAWADSSHDKDYNEDDPGTYAGEIQGVHASRDHMHEGIASTLYKMAMDPAMPTGDDTLPLHSPNRTRAGLGWSAAVGGWDPDLDDVKDRPKHPYEETEEQTAKRRPEMPGQQRLHV